MDFHIRPLEAQRFAHLFDLSDAALAKRQARRQTVMASPGTPCRVSLQDAAVGETVILLNHAHQPEDSPYRASHAIFVRQGARQAQLAVNEVPEVIRCRLVSLRLFDASHMMIDADVMPGDAVGAAIAAAFDATAVAYAHIHNAKPGCFAAAVHRV